MRERAMPSGYLSELGFAKALFYLNFHGPRRQVEFSFPQQVAF
jgi:hypothetical protein